MKIVVGARASPLSKAQAKEVFDELCRHYPEVTFSCIYVDTTGDKDLKTSLRSLNKTDFFTREVDELLLTGNCRIAIHSAKDLPEPLPAGLTLVALTRGVDPSDSLVMRPNESLETLRTGAIVATSSVRREETVKQLRSDLTFIDLRGTIEQRLEKLMNGTADGVVVAEAALIRLGLTHLNRVHLPGPTVPLQGQLAIVARTGDLEMINLFASLDHRH